jgi:hypothetical protein
MPPLFRFRSFNLVPGSDVRVTEFITQHTVAVLMQTPSGHTFRAIGTIAAAASAQLGRPFWIARIRRPVEFGDEIFSAGSLMLIGRKRLAMELPDPE